jgi:hypothetical protein
MKISQCAPADLRDPLHRNSGGRSLHAPITRKPGNQCPTIAPCPPPATASNVP